MSKNPKAELALAASNTGMGEIDVRTRSSGPAHEPMFSTEVVAAGRVLGSGDGKTKKQSERQAIAAALKALRENPTAGTELTSSEAGFGGPWPVFPDLLAACLTVANQRIEPKQGDSDSLAKVQAAALSLYKGMLLNLGELVEEEG